MKEGYKTTEFWMAAVMALLANFGPVASAAGPKTAAVVSAATGVAYMLSRGMAKSAGDAPKE